MTDELRNGLADEIGDRLHHFIGCRFDKAAHGKLPGETCTCGRDALLDRLTALEAERAKGEARVENLCALVFLAGHSEGWTGNQCRRDVQHVDAEKGWRLYVQNGALDKAIARPAAEGVREAVMREALEIVHCPDCGERHIDEQDFAEVAHHTHACQGCGLVWRPAKVNTHGVCFLPGYKNETPHA